jgi:multidrug efflux pump
MSSSQAIDAIRQLADTNLPNGLAIEWTGLSYEQIHQDNAAFWVFPLCILLVYLVLSALYESWSLPLTVILIVPLCIFSAIGGIWLVNFFHGLSFIFWPPTYAPSFLDNNVFTQIGLVVLMGLACKNAILIVEFARELEIQGRSTLEAALEACRLRLRPILMTSFAFIMGVIPLVFASGAGAEVRQVMGITVFAGMLGVTLFGLFFTPLFYVLIRHWAARREVSTKQMGDAHEI